MQDIERFNSISHLTGAALAVGGTAALVLVSAGQGDPLKVTCLAVYGSMLILAYASSGLYHTMEGKAKDVLRVADHCAIYLLIAGTYTPFTLVAIRGAWGLWLFLIVWGLAVGGVIKDAVWHGRHRVVSVILYVLMGWLIMIAFAPLRRALPSSGVLWLIIGGVIYTTGIVFYGLSKRTRHGHAIWHLFVLAGSICHFVSVLLYIAPAGSLVPLSS
jgi:hemolysin III